MIILLGSVSILFAIAYLSLLLAIRRAWHQIPEQPPSLLQTTPFVTVIVIARNEEQYITSCIQSIQNQNYTDACYEVLIFDDFSTDSTIDLSSQFESPQVRIIHLAEYINENQSGSNKKKAIEIGVEQAKGNYILVTDADCICPPDWIRSCVTALEHRGLNFVAGPVNCLKTDSFIGMYQVLDLAGLLIITGAGFNNRIIQSANGANMGFRKGAFESVGGYDGFKHLASGDDLFLLQKIEAAYPGTAGYIKSRSCMVTTRPQWGIRSFMDQRIRWASKIRAISHQSTRLMLIFMMTYYFLIVGTFLLAWVQPGWIVVFSILFISKMIADHSIIRAGLEFTGQQVPVRLYFQAEIFQILYSLVVGIRLLFRRSYTWKGRRTT